MEWHQGELFPRVGFIVTNLSYPPKGIVCFYNGRGTAEQWIKEGKHALNWTRLSCHKFVAIAIITFSRLGPSVPAIATARIKPGKAGNRSTKPIKRVSSLPP